MDVIGDLGHLALASRLKRLGDRLMQEVSAVYAAHGVGFRARWFPVMTALARESPQSVSGLASVLGLTHTGVAQIAAEMQREGLVRSSDDAADGRRRLLQLTPAGAAMVSGLQPLWRQIREATAELVGESGHDLLGAIAAVEARLAERSMTDRLEERLAAAGEVDVIGWRADLAPAFRALNVAWLEPMFGLDEADRAMLDDPASEVIGKGGQVLFALANGEAVGTCAVLPHGDAAELAKMAVAESHRGRGIGRRLVEAAIASARAAGHRRLFLLTSPRLEAAVALYRTAGFAAAAEPPPGLPGHSRCSIYMAMEIAPPGGLA